MTANNYLVREYQKTDWPTVSDWWNARTSERALNESFLPPVGVIVERSGDPLGALWVHMSLGVGIAYLENPVTKPGLSYAITVKVMGLAMQAIEAICRAHDYGVMIVNTLPSIAHWLERKQGWHWAGDRVQLIKTTR